MAEQDASSWPHVEQPLYRFFSEKMGHSVACRSNIIFSTSYVVFLKFQNGPPATS